MTNVMGLILSESNLYLSSLTEKRSIAALPIAGRYRLIDFTLSNMVNSGVTNVGIILKYKYSSLMDHLGSGKEWDLNRKKGGLHILPPYIGRNVQGLGEGDIDLIATAEDFIRKSKQKHVVISEGNIVLNINLDDVMDFHIKNNSDVTLVYYEAEEADNRKLSSHTILSIDDDDRITGIEVNPRRPKTKKIFMSLMLMEREFLHYSIDEAVARGDHDIMKDILIKNLSNLNICGYKFNGYIGCVDDIRSYHDVSIDMLNEKVLEEIFNPERPIYTKIKDQVPTRYGNDASVHNCLIADGCNIEGEVKDSIIFRGVNIGKHAKVTNSIIMQDSVVQAACELNHVILDKEVTVREAGRLIGETNHPMIIGKGEVV